MNERFDNQIALAHPQHTVLSAQQKRELARAEQYLAKVERVAMVALREQSSVSREAVRHVVEDLKYVSYCKSLYFGDSVPAEVSQWLSFVTRDHTMRMAQIPQEFSRNVLSVLERMPVDSGDEGTVREVRDYFRGLLPPG